MLALTRADEDVTDPETVRFEAVVRDAWEGVDTKDASIDRSGSGTIRSDRARLQRLLENLFRNAVEHAGPDVTVTVRLTDDGFVVADDGPGIPNESLAEAFEHGYTTSEEGTGLGLAIVEELASAHGWGGYVDPSHDGAKFVFEGCETSLDDSDPGEDEAGADDTQIAYGDAATVHDDAQAADGGDTTVHDDAQAADGGADEDAAEGVTE
ncbi:MAG: sensor histidine kinase [Halanaeroarchaeum sp.]